MTVKSAIQCMDRRTRQVGTFGYVEDRPLYSVTPVFPDYVQFVDYCNQHKIDRDCTIDKQHKIYAGLASWRQE